MLSLGNERYEFGDWGYGHAYIGPHFEGSYKDGKGICSATETIVRDVPIEYIHYTGI